MPTPAYRGLFPLIFCLLCACQQYDVTVNDRVVYNPQPLFTGYAMADSALQRCVSSAIKSNKISSAYELQELFCSDMGITDLTGISVFTGLRQLDLSDNSLSSIRELALLSSLEVVDLANNQIVDPLPLADLLALDTVDLTDNPTLHCPAPQVLLRVTQLKLPAFCN